MSYYKALKTQIFKLGEFSIIPIRFEDRFQIMKWRNEQVYHLRQNKILKEEDQNQYFENVVNSLFLLEHPDQILFSFMKENKCIGYGGLVHINWIDKNAEISFLMDTELEANKFEFLWIKFLKLIQIVAFEDIGLHKIFTYAFDLRPRLYTALKESDFEHDATLNEHCFFEGEFLNVLIHAKINHLKLRPANVLDINQTFTWASNKNIRRYSFNQEEIQFNAHSTWFISKLKNENCKYYILENILGTGLGSIRLDVENDSATISYLIDEKFFGRGLGTKIIKLLVNKIKEEKQNIKTLIGYVQQENLASVRIFEKLGFENEKVGPTIKFFKKII